MEIKSLHATSRTTRRYIVETTIALALATGKKVAVIAEYLKPDDISLPPSVNAYAPLWAYPDDAKDMRAHLETIALSGVYEVIVVEGWNALWFNPSFSAKIESIAPNTQLVHAPNADPSMAC